MKIVQMCFPGGKKKAFTMSYDDGVIQDRRLVDLMNRYGIRGTFNLNSGFLGRKESAVIDGFETDITKVTKEEASSLYRNHEIACHCLTHLKLTDVGTEVAAYEVLEDRRRLEAIAETFVRGFAYPFGSYDETAIAALKACGIRYARTVESTKRFDLPNDFMKWHPTCHHTDENLFDLAKAFCEQDALFDAPQLFYLWGHSYEFDQRNQWDRIEALFQTLVPYKKEIYFATNDEIYRYISSFQQLEYSVDGTKVFNPSCSEVFILVDGVVIKIPSGQTITIQ